MKIATFAVAAMLAFAPAFAHAQDAAAPATTTTSSTTAVKTETAKPAAHGKKVVKHKHVSHKMVKKSDAAAPAAK